MKMARLPSNSEHIGVVLAHDEARASASRPHGISVRLLLVGGACCMKDFVYSILIDTIEVLNEQVGNAATTTRNNRGTLERVEESSHPRPHFCN
jgi:hypothetical protein